MEASANLDAEITGDIFQTDTSTAHIPIYTSDTPLIIYDIYTSEHLSGTKSKWINKKLHKHKQNIVHDFVEKGGGKEEGGSLFECCYV